MVILPLYQECVTAWLPSWILVVPVCNHFTSTFTFFTVVSSQSPSDPDNHSAFMSLLRHWFERERKKMGSGKTFPSSLPGSSVQLARICSAMYVLCFLGKFNSRKVNFCDIIVLG